MNLATYVTFGITFLLFCAGNAFAHPQGHSHPTPCSYMQGKSLSQINHPVIRRQLYKQDISIHDHKTRVVACHESGKFAWITFNSPLSSNSKKVTIDTCGFLVDPKGFPVYLPTGHFEHNYHRCRPTR